MATVAQMVREFHEVFDLPRQDRPNVGAVPDYTAALRNKLLQDEVDELTEEVLAANIVGIAHELADVVYVAYGHAVTYGFDLDAVIREVHRANMSKLDEHGRPVLREDGKVLKSSLFKPADVLSVLKGPGDDRSA